MQLRLTGRYLGYAAAALFLALFGAVTLAVPVELPLVALLYAPSLSLASSLCAFAGCAVLTLIVVRTRQRSFIPLVVACCAGGFAFGAMFVAFPMWAIGENFFPVSPAAPWLLMFWNVTIAAGAMWYAEERRRNATLPVAATRRFAVVGLPIVACASFAAVLGIEALAYMLPVRITSVDARSPWETYADAAVAVLMLAALARLVQLLRRIAPVRIDLSLALGVTAAAVGALLMLFADSRVGLEWIAIRVLQLVSPLVVLVGVIRFLIERVTDSVRLESDVLRAEASAFEQNAAVEASLVKSQFVATVSHELRTPLGGIIGMAELLERTPLNAQQHYFAGAIRSSADTLLRIVNDLLDFSRAESGRVELEDEPFDLAATIEHVVTLFRLQARERGVVLHVFVDPSLPTYIRGDATRLTQVLQNLLNNAVRFTEEGTIRVEVVPELPAGVTPMIRFAVHDSGIGIAPGAQERIFAAFTQADASTARRFGGTGLGLAIAKHLVELMGGRIMVRSVVGVGSTFTFTTPLRRVDAADPAMPLRDLRVLVIEPDPTVRALLTRYVTGWEMRAVTVERIEDVPPVEVAGSSDGPFDVLIVGPSTKRDEAIALERFARSLPHLVHADAIYIGGDHCHDPETPAGFGAAVPGPLRQSTLFDAIVRLRRGGMIERAMSASGSTSLRRPRRERILVADDNEVNRALLAAQLEFLGFRADVVDNGAAAVDAAITSEYDLIFMDCQMPEVDGFEAARRIRSRPDRGAVPIIAVTANVLPGYRDVCVAAGMNDYLAKPALIDPLAQIVDRWLPGTSGSNRASAAPPPREAPRDDLRARLREIFRGDDARVDATISLAATSLRSGLIQITDEIAAAGVDAAARTAHKLKGIALEIGFVDVVDLARSLEDRIRAADWPAAEAACDQMSAAIAREMGLPDGMPS